MQLQAIAQLYWHSQLIEPGGIVTIETPQDEALLAYYGPFGVFVSVPGEAPPEPPGESGEPPEGGGTPPISTEDGALTAPHIIGRRRPIAPSD